MSSEKMSATEKRAVLSLSFIMSLRMIGLFMVLPVFSLYAHGLIGATPLSIGLAMGIYGLSQAIFQIPFGALSDRFGRKPIIVLGLCIFSLGSLIAAFADSITWMIIARALQGVGAVGSTILAFIADTTREEQRTKAMAIAGITIGFSFSIAMFIGPILTKWVPINALFLLAALLGIVAIFALFSLAPAAPRPQWHRDTTPELKSFLTLFIQPELAKLNSGIFILHAIFTASFMVIPLSFSGLSSDRQWQLYLPALLFAFIVSIFCMGFAERKQQLKHFFLGGIFTLTLAELILWFSANNWAGMMIGLSLFFAGFSLLEAFLPSLISRTAPASRKGSALGIYSCSQFFGIFVGGVLGGWLYGKFSFAGVYLFCITLSLFWFALAYFMQPPRYLVTQLLKLLPSQQAHWDNIAAKLQIIPGMLETTFIAEDGVAYLKMERATTKHPDFIRLKEQLQSK
ncbi:MAG: MFS transporter [Gammaproteobacteria bacterium]|nr:MFS transporter [Gammaproteobacteria bacterium]